MTIIPVTKLHSRRQTPDNEAFGQARSGQLCVASGQAIEGIFDEIDAF